MKYFLRTNKERFFLFIINSKERGHKQGEDVKLMCQEDVEMLYIPKLECTLVLSAAAL